MKTAAQIFDALLDAYDGVQTDRIMTAGVDVEARLEEHLAELRKYREEFRAARVRLVGRPLDETAQLAARGIEPAGSVVHPPRVGPGDHLLRPVGDDELVCTACGRPHALHGIACPMLSDHESVADRSERLAERHTRDDGSSR